jgi:hypothetical protein
MPFLVSVGRLGRSLENRQETGARGYEIKRVGKTVHCRWAGVFVLGPTTYVWRRSPSTTTHRKKTEAEARAFLRAHLERLQHKSHAYVRLGPGVIIRDAPHVGPELARIRRGLRRRAAATRS